MEDRKDPSKIAEEAVGLRPENATPTVAKESVEGASVQNVADRARSAGAWASVAERTAEAMGEHDSGAYAHRLTTPQQAHQRSRDTVSRGRGQWTVEEALAMSVIAAFGIGYAAALLLHRR